MYLALVLSPWMLMYALSTMMMNHRAFFKRVYGSAEPAFEKESERVYDGTFSPEAKPKDVGRQILKDLDIDGVHSVRSEAGGRLVISRKDPAFPRRIAYTPQDKKLIVERQALRAPTFLEELHRSRGYTRDYPWRNAWAFSVDLVIVAMVFWAASGVWMWLELSGTRRWGVLFLGAGLALFVFFVATI